MCSSHRCNNRDLTAAIAAGSFRADLFYRLNVLPIDVPLLREWREDIPILVDYFVKRRAGQASCARAIPYGSRKPGFQDRTHLAGSHQGQKRSFATGLASCTAD
jgi:sigma54-dependent transcription regulator